MDSHTPHPHLAGLGVELEFRHRCVATRSHPSEGMCLLWSIRPGWCGLSDAQARCDPRRRSHHPCPPPQTELYPPVAASAAYSLTSTTTTGSSIALGATATRVQTRSADRVVALLIRPDRRRPRKTVLHRRLIIHHSTKERRGQCARSDRRVYAAMEP